MDTNRFITIDGREIDLLKVTSKSPDWNNLTTKEQQKSIRLRSNEASSTRGKKKKLIICYKCKNKAFITLSRYIQGIPPFTCKNCRKNVVMEKAKILNKYYFLNKERKEYWRTHR